MVTQVAVLKPRPGSTHREVTYLQLGSPANVSMCVAVWRMQQAGCLHACDSMCVAV